MWQGNLSVPLQQNDQTDFLSLSQQVNFYHTDLTEQTPREGTKLTHQSGGNSPSVFFLIEDRLQPNCPLHLCRPYEAIPFTWAIYILVQHNQPHQRNSTTTPNPIDKLNIEPSPASTTKHTPINPASHHPTTSVILPLIQYGPTRTIRNEVQTM